MSPIADQIEAISPFLSQRDAISAPKHGRAVYDEVEKKGLVTGLEFEDGVSAGKGWLVAVADAPVERVWASVVAEDRYAGHFGLSESAFLSGDLLSGDRLVFQMLPLPIVSDRWLVSRESANADLYRASGGRVWEMSWTDATDPKHLAGTRWEPVAAGGAPIAWSKGAWMLVPLEDGRTLVEYYVWSDPGGSLPAGVASRLGAGALGKTISELEIISSGWTLSAGERPDGTPLSK